MSKKRGSVGSTAKSGEAQVEPPPLPQPAVYVKALPLQDIRDLEKVKSEVGAGNVVILRITPLAKKSVEDVKRAINELCEYVKVVGGDIARLGEERIVVTPASIKIWRKGTQQPSRSEATVAE